MTERLAVGSDRNADFTALTPWPATQRVPGPSELGEGGIGWGMRRGFGGEDDAVGDAGGAVAGGRRGSRGCVVRWGVGLGFGAASSGVGAGGRAMAALREVRTRASRKTARISP